MPGVTATFLNTMMLEIKIGKKGKELKGCHWLKIWLSDVSATTVAFFSKRWKMQMLNGVLLEYVIDV